MSVASLHRTLEQELFAVLRGASLECPVCGEFVLHEGAARRLPGMRDAPARERRRRRQWRRIERAGRVTAGALACSRKVRTPQGRMLSAVSFNC